MVVEWGSSSGVEFCWVVFCFRVGCVCWRHTTKPDGAWVWRMLAADVNVRTLGGARCGAPPPGRGGFVSDGCFWLVVVLDWVHVRISKWVARELSGRQNSKLWELRLVVCTVWCRYGSTHMGELGSGGERWTVHVIQRALCPPVYRSSGGHARSEDGRCSSFKLPTHSRCVVQ
jgi:hypothetical protein